MGPGEALVAKAWKGHAQLSTVGKAAESKATPEDDRRRRRLCLQRGCPTLTPRRARTRSPARCQPDTSGAGPRVDSSPLTRTPHSRR